MRHPTTISCDFFIIPPVFEVLCAPLMLLRRALTENVNNPSLGRSFLRVSADKARLLKPKNLATARLPTVAFVYWLMRKGARANSVLVFLVEQATPSVLSLLDESITAELNLWLSCGPSSFLFFSASRFEKARRKKRLFPYRTVRAWRILPR